MTKVDIISGFLGAGKTTFIKELIAKVYRDEKIVLIENEFGEIGIDSHFMQDSGIEVTEMNSGCICCTLVGDFARSLREVSEKFHPDRIIIEPSGVGKLSDVAKAVIDMEEEADVEIDSLITVVDGKKAAMYMKNFGEFFNDQIQHAGTIVISRTQDMEESKIDKCVKTLRQKNSDAAVVTTPWKILSADMIASALDNKHALKEVLEELCHDHHHEHGYHHDDHEYHHKHCDCHHDHHEDHHHADDVFSSWGRETVHKFKKSELEDILRLMAATDDFGTVLRAKGRVEAENGRWIEFDMVPEELEIRDSQPDYIGRICVIGTDLDESALNQVFGVN